ncbi:uncharacterized protein DNG_02020 [Cephalotrichum gorgonifer]|uniref:Uncharacterized protein n=1 Tax=Cephalotrichum gorgonifer TaxID=2041049 RepID=A0AAE8SSQ5_9PEZI|nr:uncharacterized protein DNG_02020 [Cephalotrichum gorgonifer]
MAPGASDEKVADGDRSTTTKKPVSARSTSRKNASSSRKTQSERAPNKASRASTKKRTYPSKLKVHQAPAKVTKNQHKADQSISRMMIPRNLFEEHQPEEGPISGNATEVAEYSGNVKKYMDSLSDVDNEVVKAERSMINDALKRCRGKVDPSPPQDGLYSISGISTPLTPIQIATLGWMQKREALRRTGGRGGIVAHDMGLGKTLMAISLMVVNRVGLRKPKGEDCSTLIVVPNEAMITHWQEECVKHTSGVLPVSEMARYKDLKALKTVDSFRKPGIVFATYGELARDVPDGYKERKGPDTPENTKYSWPSIFEAKWHRVILDEGHAIKNRESKSSISVRRLQKSCAWVITGTPLSNSQEEMYPYFNFLNLEGSEDPMTFTQIYFPNGMASPKFRAELADAMIRKRIGESFLGQEIIPLPAHHASTRMLVPTSKEKVILSFIESKMRDRAEKGYQEALDSDKTKKAALLKGYSSGATLLHIYRYAAIHPFLLEGAFMDEFDVEEVEQLIQELEQADGSTEDGEEAHSPNPLPMEKLLKIALSHRKLGKTKCSKCKKPCATLQSMIYKLPCDHFVCFGCLSPQLTKVMRNHSKLDCPAKTCSYKFDFYPGAEFYSTLLWPEEPDAASKCQEGTDSEDSASEPDENPRKRRRGGRSKEPVKSTPRKPGPGLDANGMEPALPANRQRFFTCAGKFLDKSKLVVPSAKIVGVQELIREWRQIAPEDKIIVFTQFMAVARLVGRIAQKEKTEFLYYTGDLPPVARKSALERFRNDPSVKLLITSLMCGSQGLNITSANRVILLELWWNSPAEEQAFARVYRMGQKKAVHVVRFQCAGTREDDIAIMQRMKNSELSDCLMTGKTTKSNHSLHSIMALMGLPVMDRDGAVTGFKKSTEDLDFVVSDDEETEQSDEFGESEASEGSEESEERVDKEQAKVPASGSADLQDKEGEKQEKKREEKQQDSYEDRMEVDGNQEDTMEVGEIQEKMEVDEKGEREG